MDRLDTGRTPPVAAPVPGTRHTSKPGRGRIRRTPKQHRRSARVPVLLLRTSSVTLRRRQDAHERMAINQIIYDKSPSVNARSVSYYVDPTTSREWCNDDKSGRRMRTVPRTTRPYKRDDATVGEDPSGSPDRRDRLFLSLHVGMCPMGRGLREYGTAGRRVVSGGRHLPWRLGALRMRLQPAPGRFR